MDSKYEENLREEALKFVDQVQEAFFHTNDSDNKWGQFRSALKLFNDEIITNETLVQTLTNLFQGHENLLSGYRKIDPESSQTQTSMEKSREFLTKVQERFGKRIAEYRKVLDSIIAYGEGELGRIELYKKMCTLLTGYHDLFLEFESTFFNDGGEETRREVEKVRVQIQEDFKREVGVMLGNYGSVIATIRKAPEKLTADHLAGIREVCGGVDLIQDLRKDYVLARLEKKYRDLRRAHDFVLLYFSRIFSAKQEAGAPQNVENTNSALNFQGRKKN